MVQSLRISALFTIVSFLLAASSAAENSFLVQLSVNSNPLGRRQASSLFPSNVLEEHLKQLEDLTHTDSASSDSTFRPVSVGDTFTIGDFVGYAVEMSPSLVEAVEKLPSVTRILPNSMATADATPTNCTTRPINSIGNSGEWGLGRISHFGNTPDPWRVAHNTYRYNPVSQCTTTTAYILDSGVSRNHPEFIGREIRWGYQSNSAWPADDVCGHGSHTAGILGGRNYGVQSATQLVAIKALEGEMGGLCTGPWSGVISGMAWAVEDARSKGILGNSVILMSLGGSYNPIVNNAVNAVVGQGLTVVVSAGNNREDACLASPASAEKTITVGNINQADEMAYWSNSGCCVDIWAPGENIASAYVGSTYQILSGTSMAAPYVAGMVLYNKCRFGYTAPAEDKIAITTKENVIRKKIVVGEGLGFCTETPDAPLGGICVPGVGGGCAPNKIVYNRC